MAARVAALAATPGALVALHAVDAEAAGLANFGKPEGYVERQVRGWSEPASRDKTPAVFQ